MAMTMTLEMRNICKSFGANDVLKDISFSIAGGEICALLGENGAGKSTLMNILGGVLPADAGTILLDGKEVQFSTPAKSLDAGIAFIHQELNLVNDLAIYENMFIGREIKRKGGFLDAPAMIEKCREVFARMDVDIDPALMVRDLDASYKQIVEIARALLMKASIIIMDEPTTSLTEPEIERVFDMMRTLQGQGVAMVFISHKLKEVLAVCTRYTVLRDGAMVAEGSVEGVTVDELATHMVGHQVRTESLRQERELGKEVLRAEGLSQERFHDVSFSLRAGEVLGFTGLLGDGRSELFQAVFGSGGRVRGQLYLEGVPVQVHSTRQALALGIGYVPRNRKENGIIKDMDILENGSIVTWPRNARFGVIDWGKVREGFQKQVQGLRIKMDSEKNPIGSLSGGNQQKVVLAKWMLTEPDVLILDEPTRGIDVGAKYEIYCAINELAKSGKAVIVISSEMPEIIGTCDRTYVLNEGQIAGELSKEELSQEKIMKCIMQHNNQKGA